MHTKRSLLRPCGACMHLLVVLACMLVATHVDAAVGRAGGFSGGSRTSFTPSSRPAVAAPAPAAKPSTFSSLPSSFSGYRYSRPGYRSNPIIFPLAAGALAGAALYSLNSNPNAYCNGFSVQCYKNACQQALAQCADANSTSLVVATCPDPRFSECWQSSDQIFQCFGTRRPRLGNDDLAVYCNQPILGSSAGSASVHMVLMAVLMLLAVLLV